MKVYSFLPNGTSDIVLSQFVNVEVPSARAVLSIFFMLF